MGLRASRQRWSQALRARGFTVHYRALDEHAHPTLQAALTADLAIAAKQQEFHAMYCGKRSGAISASSGATASLPDSDTSASGQSIASCGSSQRSALSLARS